MKRIILASSLLFGMGCGDTTGTGPAATDCSELVVLSEEEISINSGILPAESCWLVESDFTLSRALSVKEGVVIELAQGVRFLVGKEASLTVEGTSEKPVFFTGSEKTLGFWRGIEFQSKNSANKLDHTIVEYAGSRGFTGAPYSKGAIYVDAAQVSISNSVLRNNAGAGFVFFGEATVALENSEISGNEIAGRVASDLVGQIADSNTWDANTDPSVHVGIPGSGASNRVTTNQTWLDLGTSLKLDGGMDVNSELSIAPNTTFFMSQETAILIADDGSFNLVGTAEKPITFEGTDATQGFWKGIQFRSKNSANIFDYVKIMHAGGSGWNGAADSTGAIFMEAESKLVLTNSEISMSGGFALIARIDGDISGFSNNVIKDNAQELNLDVGQLGALNGDSIYENNAEPFISVPRGTLDLSVVWKKQTTPIRFVEKVTISDDLQIEPGVAFEFGEKGTILVAAGGSMNAEGTASDKITFTGADKIAGFWKGIAYESNSSQNILKHVVISFGGAEKWNGAADTEGNIYLREGRLDISDSKVGDSAGYAIVNSGDSELVGCTNIDFSGNAKGEVLDARGTLVSACP